jgi:hypothetical protein
MFAVSIHYTTAGKEKSSSQNRKQGPANAKEAERIFQYFGNMLPLANERRPSAVVRLKQNLPKLTASRHACQFSLFSDWEIH